MFSSTSSIVDYIKQLEENDELIYAMNHDSLVIFIGAGISANYGLPTWNQFAKKYLDYVYENRARIGTSTAMNYKAYEDIQREDTLTILSICHNIAINYIPMHEIDEQFNKWFLLSPEKIQSSIIYPSIYNTNAIFVTTNYDNALDLLANTPLPPLLTENESILAEGLKTKGHVYYSADEIDSVLNLKSGDVVHIHGSIRNNYYPKIVSREDYLRLYHNGTNGQMKFLEDLFNNKTVLFAGYGLSEMQILQFLFHSKKKNRYLLLDCYPDDFLKIDYYDRYLFSQYSVRIIPYNKAEVGYTQITELFEKLSSFTNVKHPTDLKRFKLQKGLNLINKGEW